MLVPKLAGSFESYLPWVGKLHGYGTGGKGREEDDGKSNYYLHTIILFKSQKLAIEPAKYYLHR